LADFFSTITGQPVADTPKSHDKVEFVVIDTQTGEPFSRAYTRFMSRVEVEAHAVDLDRRYREPGRFRAAILQHGKREWL
jgi:hypothetical protein